MEQVKVGLIGCGRFGTMHGEVLSDLETVKLCAVADPAFGDRAARPAWAEGVPWYSDYRELLARDDIQAVHICIPDRDHVEVLEAAIDADKHIFVEKPLTHTSASAMRMYERSRQSRKKHTVGFILRFNPASVLARESIRSGAIGDIVYVSSRRVSPMSGGIRYGNVSNLAIHSCVHDIDLARWLVGSEYRSVFSRCRRETLRCRGIDTQDVLLSSYELENGVIYSQENSWALAPSYPYFVDGSMQVIGTAGSLHIDYRSQGLTCYDEDRVSHPDLHHWPLLSGRRSGDLRAEIEHFHRAIRRDEEVRVSFYDGYVATLVAEAVLQSVDRRQEITIG